jgi:hypothetical protein
MTFTYNGTLVTDLDRIRFEIQDTVSSSGPKPGTGTATNFTDEEINGALTIAGSVHATIGMLYKALWVAWARYVDTRIGPRDEKLSKAAKDYKALAIAYGASVSIVTTGSINLGIDEEDSEFDIT